MLGLCWFLMCAELNVSGGAVDATPPAVSPAAAPGDPAPTARAPDMLAHLSVGSDDSTQPIALAQASAGRFGAQGTWRFNIHGAYGIDLDDTDETFGLAGVGLSCFLIDDLALETEFNGVRIEQRGEDPWGFNFNLLLRWHVVARETWSFYLDGGAGLLFSGEDVPEGASNVNFTPQLGAGFSFDLGSNTRLLTGIRWHHISNANTEVFNPGRDSFEVYAGVSLPF